MEHNMNDELLTVDKGPLVPMQPSIQEQVAQLDDRVKHLEEVVRKIEAL
jgi:hypothetical protein